LIVNVLIQTSKLFLPANSANTGSVLYICKKRKPSATEHPPRMQLNKRIFLGIGLLCSLLCSCQNSTGTSTQAAFGAQKDSLSINLHNKSAAAASAMVSKGGIEMNAPSVKPLAPVAKSSRKLTSSVLIPAEPDTMPYIQFDPLMLQALYQQAIYLGRSDVKENGASGITKTEMLKAVELLEGVQLLDPEVLLQTFDFYRINTDQKSDRVRITGYYTPLVSASRTRTAEYQYPLLRKPSSGVPSPSAIAGGALAGRKLELAWVKTKKELKNAQLQGSCLVEFPDGQREYYGFGGSVKGAGGTYVFFTKVDETVLGAGSFPLTSGYSVAVDTRFIPIGSTIFAELPDLDAAGHLKGYTYRVFFAQDRGGAIKSTKRLDLYCGVGQKGLQEARRINGFGRLWVMLPK
jgi:3D (Asp-Asp-Asp) domain-containing protein